MLTCSKCGIEKAETEFSKEPRRARGFKYHCKACYNAATRALNQVNPNSRKREWLQRLYGVTLAQYNALLISQNGVCAICQKLCATGRALSVDHCHETGHIRGLLCGNCNRALGALQDSPNNCLAAASYLQRLAQIPTPRVDSVGYMSPC